jgi:hypothetical protein
MRYYFLGLGLFFSLFTNAYADLARAMSCHKKELGKNDECTMLLIGTIDSIYGQRIACPDGNTSYGYIIQAWVRDMRRNPERESFATVKSMQVTMNDLGLRCK